MPLKEECEALLDALLSAAENLLKKNGEFYPIGAVLTVEDTLSFTAASYEDNDFPESRQVIDDLTSAHRQMAQQCGIRASGIAWNAAVRSPDGEATNAIVVSMEHVSGYSVIVGAPYSIGRPGCVKLGELFAQSGTHHVFPAEETM